MFKEKTVFVLGAGASCPYGYPIGKDLIKCILKDMDDEIFLPTPAPADRGKFFLSKWDEENGRYYPFDWWKGAQDIEAKITRETKFYRRESESPYIFQEEKRYFSRKCIIKCIQEFKNLHDALVQFDPVSIDAFLRDNPSFREAGKTMIVYSLLKREDKSKFSILEKSDNWYSYFLNDLASDCADNLSKFLENNLNLTILTFNYDISLDFYLRDRLKKIEAFNKDDIADRFIEEFKIEHIYGNVGNDDNEYGDHFADNNTEKTELTLKRFLTSIRRLEQIKTMHDERPNHSREQYFNKLKEARNIIFIGFGFDRANLDQIGLPSEQNEWQDFSFGKIIKWLNYNGNMTGLSGQFNRISQSGSIIESIANNIVTAYQNDFKASLF